MRAPRSCCNYGGVVEADLIGLPHGSDLVSPCSDCLRAALPPQFLLSPHRIRWGRLRGLVAQDKN